ncbi:hypothetical protein LX69_01129 [Breznakibacter xylanolyticus]|uniref:Uncharacterized protein n=1 Tax=Breznakibacter xylanolyticus TaxID=990 RepID=A0A2W7P3V8_9BACT|nr:SAM-dependent methyltransferase [Breznakibacter xylanolyticus]PZX18092.1 hypothetical protein LX69_01129 [Breznakibacter xylanolyticus]
MEIKLDERNYRKHNEANKQIIKKSVDELGAGRSILVDKEGQIIAGNGVFEQWGDRPVKVIETDGNELVVVKRNDLSPDDPRRQQLAFADNHASDLSEWNEDLLREDWEKLELDGWNIELTEDDKKLAIAKHEEAKASLAERFIIPPFSVLDSRQGYWQNRKNAWINLGIRSEEGGRDKMKVSGALSGSVPRYYEYKTMAETKVGRKLSNKEFEEDYLMDMMPKESNLAVTETGAMLSIFDPVLCELSYKWFCPNGGTILDPFAGGSVRGIVASYLGYHYTGIDLRAEQIEANIKQGQRLVANNMPNWIIGNSCDIPQLVSNQFDMVYSCPPYFDLEVYSEKEGDLSNMEWEDFKRDYAKIISESVSRLKENRFACFVVGDVRDEKGFYRDFVGYTIECFENAGAKYYNEMILVNVAGSLPIRVGKQFSTSRKVGKCHQNVLVFFKGDPKTIKDNFTEIEVDGLDEQSFE